MITYDLYIQLIDFQKLQSTFQPKKHYGNKQINHLLIFYSFLTHTLNIINLFLFMSDPYLSRQDSDDDSDNEDLNEQRSSQDTKQMHKNKIINKIKGLGGQDKGTKEDYSYKGLNKKDRNKLSARISRERKKTYMKMLEEKQQTLTKQLQSRKKQLEETKGYLQRVVNQNKTMSGFTASRHQMMKKIEGLLQKAKNGEDPSVQLNEIIDSLRYRIGATGKERINTINQYFRQIVNLSLPALHRYMMWSAAENRHLFGNDQQEDDEWFVELRDSLNLSEEQKRQIRSKREFLKQQKQLLEKLIGDLKDIKNDIQQKSIELEDMIDGIREILTPLQAAHFILFIEKNKYRKQLNLCEATIEEQESTLRKMIKKQD